MPSSQSEENKGVWLSREEYDRLRQADTQRVGVAEQEPEVTSAAQPPVVSARSNSLQTTTGVVLAVGLLMAVTIEGLRWIFVPALCVFVIFAGVSINDMIKARRARSSGTVYATNRSAYIALLITGSVVIISPLILGILALILITALMTSSGGRGS